MFGAAGAVKVEAGRHQKKARRKESTRRLRVADDPNHDERNLLEDFPSWAAAVTQADTFRYFGRLKSSDVIHLLREMEKVTFSEPLNVLDQSQAVRRRR